MACHTSLRSRNRTDGSRAAAIGLRVLPTLLSIVIIATASFEEVDAFAEGTDGKFGAGSNAPSGAGSPAGAPVESAARDGAEVESWDNGIERPDACSRRRDVAEACGSCPGLAPALGISAWQCCNDAGAQRVCFETVAAVLIDRASALAAAADNGADAEDDEYPEDPAVDKRAKYFLGKRAKYFLGKRAFDARRSGAAYRPPTMRHEMLSDDFALLGNGRRARGDRQLASEKRAKYFLG